MGTRIYTDCRRCKIMCRLEKRSTAGAQIWTICVNQRPGILLYGDAFCKVSRLIYISSLDHCHMVGKQL